MQLICPSSFSPSIHSNGWFTPAEQQTYQAIKTSYATYSWIGDNIIGFLAETDIASECLQLRASIDMV